MTGVLRELPDLYQAYSFGYEAGFYGNTISNGSGSLADSIQRLGWYDGNADREWVEDEWPESDFDDDDCAAEDIDTQRRAAAHRIAYRASFRPPVT